MYGKYMVNIYIWLMVNDGGIFTPASVCRTYFSEVSTSSREGGRKRLVNQLVSAQQISAAPNCVVGKYEKAPCSVQGKDTNVQWIVDAVILYNYVV